MKISCDHTVQLLRRHADHLPDASLDRSTFRLSLAWMVPARTTIIRLFLLLSCLFQITSTALFVSLAASATTKGSISSSAAAVSVIDVVLIVVLSCFFGLRLCRAAALWSLFCHTFGILIWFTAVICSLAVYGIAISVAAHGKQIAIHDHAIAIAGLATVIVGLIPQIAFVLLTWPHLEHAVRTCTPVLRKPSLPVQASSNPPPQPAALSTRASHPPPSPTRECNPPSVMDWSDGPSPNYPHPVRRALRYLARIPSTPPDASMPSTRDNGSETWDTSAVAARSGCPTLPPIPPFPAVLRPPESSYHRYAAPHPSSVVGTANAAAPLAASPRSPLTRSSFTHADLPSPAVSPDQSHIHPLFRTPLEGAGRGDDGGPAIRLLGMTVMRSIAEDSIERAE